MELVLTVVVIGVTIKWGKFANWKQYYPTYLFWALGNFVYLHITKAKPLWILLGYPAYNENILPDPVVSVMLAFAICFTALVNIIMITYYLKLKWWWNWLVISVLYIAFYIAYRTNYIIYRDFNLLMFFATVQIIGTYICVFVIDRLYALRTEE